ncbi:MAG TPA: ABC transporter permease subunit [Anaerolineales bacterium]|nr:ABC transporter permease subunit [Anaerolineales bacterium]
MASNSEFQSVGNQGWPQGFANLVRKENHLWWLTRRWWVQTLIWLAFISGLLAMFIWVVPSNTEGSTGESEIPPEVKCLIFITWMSGIAPAIGVTMLGQDAILNERQSGTMAWVLTKPASRSAFMLSKLISNAFGILMTMVVFQVCSAYLLIFIATGQAFSPLHYAAMSGIIFLSLLFYLTLTLMLSTISNGRGLVIGIPLLIVLASQFIGRMLPAWLLDFLPWSLTASFGDAQASALYAAIGEPLPTWMPVITTAVWCLIFVGIAMWRLHREEF